MPFVRVKDCKALGGNSLFQDASADLETPVLLRLQRVQRLPGVAIRIDDVDLLVELPFIRRGFAELETAMPIDWSVPVAHHGHENIRRLEHAFDAGSSEGVGC